MEVLFGEKQSGGDVVRMESNSLVKMLLVW